MRGSNLLFLASWVILLMLSVAVVLVSVQSLWLTYTGGRDGLTQEFTITQIAEHGGDEAVKAFRGRRATAATWAIGYALLAMPVIWIPYRRGERWAWWALLASLGLSQLLSVARAIALGTTLGLGTPALVLAFLLLGLLAGTQRIFSDRNTSL